MVAGLSTPLVALDAVVLDTETTGLDSRTARLVQIGALRITSGAIDRSSVFDRLINPRIPIPPETTAIHGIDDAAVQSAKTFAEVASELMPLLSDTVLIGHTIGYDLAVLQRETQLAGLQWQPPRSLDVHLLARIASPSLAHYDLDRLCAWLNVENPARHTALGDALATAEVFVKLVPKLRELGIRTLAEVEAASRHAAERGSQTGQLPMPLPASPADAVPVLQTIDSFPYRHRVSDVMSAPALTVPANLSVNATINLLVERKTSSVFVEHGELRGIVTERDLLRVVAAEGALAFSMPISAVMNSPLITIGEDDFVYRAIGRIERHAIRHLGVVDGTDKLVGAVTTRNLLRHRATTALVLGDEIDRAQSAAELASAWSKLTHMARSLSAEAVDARHIAAVVSAEVCAITARAAVLAERHLKEQSAGSAPTPYCVLVLGSAGRGESLLAADQDNAIVFATGEPDGPEDRWFADLAHAMTRILDEAGVPLCKGGVMASNSAWRMSAHRWRETVDSWVGRQKPVDLLNTDIFFDAVPVHGDIRLGKEIVEYAWSRAGQSRDFIKLIEELARSWRSPLTILGNIRTDQDGRADLKKGGLLPMFTGARALALKHGARARSTPERLRALGAKGIASADQIEGIATAHKQVLGALLTQQLIDSERGVPLSPRVELSRLGKAERAELKAALGKVSALMDIVGEGRL